jgi:hypothetical protein
MLAARGGEAQSPTVRTQLSERDHLVGQGETSRAGQTVLLTAQRQVTLGDVPGGSQALVMDHQRAFGHPQFLERAQG